MASKVWASRAASYLRISISPRGFATGSVESVKATSDINSLVSGKVVEVIDKLGESPSLVNTSPYKDGRIIQVEVGNEKELYCLMDPDQYSMFCEVEEEIGNH